MDLKHSLFTTAFAVSTSFFFYSCCQRLRLVGIGTAEDRFDRLGTRLNATIKYAFAQKRVLARPYGANHFIIFWAFLLLLTANGEFIIEALFPGASLAAVMPASLYHGLTVLWDFVSLVVLISVAIAGLRRLFFPPPYLANEYTRAASGEALLILGMIAALMVAFFLMNAAGMALGPKDQFRPVSAALASLFFGASPATLQLVAEGAWWVHALVLLFFMNLLPRSKHMHILTAIPNCFFQSLEKPNAQPRETFARGANYGAGNIDQFSWKDLLDSLTCAECGRCQDLCPAHNTGKALNPRRVVHDIKVNLLANGPAISSGGQPSMRLIGELGEGTISEGAIWSCTTCGACTTVCPVMIEQMPKIVKLRRHLVQDLAIFPEELLNLFENMEQRSNPWGIAPADRIKWSTLLGDRTFKPGETEYLFFVGCAGAFDNRNKHVTFALATLLDKAGVSWGILGKDELCCGESVRRLGNEYVFDRIARANVELFRERKVTKIITQCPHCFSALKNDYRQFGLDLQVIPHSQMISNLIGNGSLSLGKKASSGKVIFHDSCYLGRHNDVYDAPRAVLAAATGTTPVEFGRHQEKAFCCGAGGGRMWMEEQSGSRINLERVREAMEQNPDTLCVSCPYCMTMMEDGLKDLGFGDRVRVKDIAEVAAESLGH